MRGVWLALIGSLACARIVGADFDVEKKAECVRVLPPPPPEGRDAGGNISLVVASSSINLGEAPGADGKRARLNIGYDHDGLCTSQGDKPKCLPPAWTLAKPVLDGIGGRDNAIGAMLAAQESTFGVAVIVSSEITTEIGNGTIAPFLLLSVSGFNGLADDDAVDVTLYLPARTGLGGAPKWNGSDAFPVATATRASRAYVNKYRLVAEFPATITVRLRNVPMTFGSGMVTGVLTTIPGSTPRQWVLREGLVAGIGFERNVFGATAGLSKEIFGTAICRNNPNYARVKTFFCSHTDVSSRGDRCDSFSVGIGFDTSTALIGKTDTAPETVFCPIPGEDPSTDDCSAPPQPPDAGT